MQRLTYLPVSIAKFEIKVLQQMRMALEAVAPIQNPGLVFKWGPFWTLIHDICSADLEMITNLVLEGNVEGRVASR